jgi:TetR/AcrR family transcriptional regulator, tetracycline repressor protein
LDREIGGNGNGRLNRDLICEVAIETIEQVGLDAVSMRMLARTLGVKASSLYHHFGSKEQLMTGVAEFLYHKLGQPPPSDDWAEQVKGTFTQLCDFIQGHPNAAPLLVRDLARSPVALERADVLLKLVRRAGIGPEMSASLLSNLVALLVGHTLLSAWAEQDAGLAASQGGSENDGAASKAWARKLFPSESVGPRGDELKAGAGSGLGNPSGATSALECSVDSIFSAGLDALITGFASRPH